MPKVILEVKLYSLQEVAELLGVKQGTVTKYINDGRLDPVLISGKKYVSEENLKGFLQEPNRKNG